ncbi:unnamed protein product [Candidula unifasciata]|uniref:Uncharacterized protein n=1 Tax=Candidula unifasciata TaxID=100452 RepID=A0A8S3ZGN2_9EUPU|nr:unnamed protein product [Candidula unifasciata]
MSTVPLKSVGFYLHTAQPCPLHGLVPMFLSSLEMFMLTAFLWFMFAADTMAESGTMTIAGCRVRPLSHPPDLTGEARCQWYLGQIGACQHVNFNGDTTISQTYRAKATELGCLAATTSKFKSTQGATTSEVKSTQGATTGEVKSSQVAGESGTMVIAGCRYKPLAPPPSLPESQRCKWYTEQMAACKGRSPMFIDGVNVNPAETYRKRAAELGCQGAGPALASCLFLCLVLNGLAYFLSGFN